MLVNRDGWVTVPLTMQATASRYSETVHPGAAPALGGGRDDRSRLPPARSGVEKAGVSQNVRASGGFLSAGLAVLTRTDPSPDGRLDAAGF